MFQQLNLVTSRIAYVLPNARKPAAVHSSVRGLHPDHARELHTAARRTGTVTAYTSACSRRLQGMLPKRETARKGASLAQKSWQNLRERACSLVAVAEQGRAQAFGQHASQSVHISTKQHSEDRADAEEMRSAPTALAARHYLPLQNRFLFLLNKELPVSVACRGKEDQPL